MRFTLELCCGGLSLTTKNSEPKYFYFYESIILPVLFVSSVVK